MAMPYQQFPTNFNGMYNQQPMYATPPQQTQPTNFMTIVPVDGESNMNTYPVAPGNTVFLIDFNSNKLWIKSKDNNGVPLPTQKFKLTQEPLGQNSAPNNQNNYVSMDKFNQLIGVVDNLNDKFTRLMNDLSPSKSEN